MKSFMTLCLVTLFLTSIVGCNMMRGAGKDVENAGKSVQKTVDHND